MMSSGRINQTKMLGNLVIALAFMAMGPATVHAGMTTISSPAKAESTLDWSNRIEGASTSSVDTQSLFAAETSTSSANIEMQTIRPTPTPAEAPMPPAALSGSILLIISAIAARTLKRKLAI